MTKGDRSSFEPAGGAAPGVSFDGAIELVIGNALLMEMVEPPAKTCTMAKSVPHVFVA